MTAPETHFEHMAKKSTEQADKIQDTQEPQVSERTLEEDILDAAVRKIGDDLAFSVTITEDDESDTKRHKLVDGFERTTEILSDGVISEYERTEFHDRVIDSLKGINADDINNRLVEEMQRANQQFRQEILAHHQTKEQLYGLQRELKHRKFELLAKQRDLSDEELRGAKGALIVGELMFIESLLDKHGKPDEPPTRILPDTDELEAHMAMESPEVTSPARGISLKSIASAVGIGKRP